MQTDIPSIQQIQAVLQALPKGELTRISRESGVPFGTLWKVRSGETPNPGIETVRSFLPHIQHGTISEQKPAPALDGQAFGAMAEGAANA